MRETETETERKKPRDKHTHTHARTLTHTPATDGKSARETERDKDPSSGGDKVQVQGLRNHYWTPHFCFLRQQGQMNRSHLTRPVSTYLGMSVWYSMIIDIMIEIRSTHRPRRPTYVLCLSSTIDRPIMHMTNRVCVPFLV